MNIFINFLKHIVKTKFFANFFNLSSIQISNTLLMILMIPLITRIVGIEMFGQIMVANAFAALAAILVSYATTQTSVKDIAIGSINREILSTIFTETLVIRTLFFIIIFVFILLAQPIFSNNYLLYLTAIPLIFAEVVNPLFFYLGMEDLKLFNLSNLITKILTILGIIFFIHSKADGIWVNFIIGGLNSINYALMLLLIFRKNRLQITYPPFSKWKKIIKENFYLVGNNFSVFLQQSIILFALQIWSTDAILGAYSLSDKVIWSCRILIISIANSIYPMASKLYSEHYLKYIEFKRNVKLGTGIIFFLGSIVLFLFPDFIVHILTGKPNELGSLFLRQMSFVPFIASLNFMNVLDRLLNNDNYTIFRIALIILIVATAISCGLVALGNFQIIGYYILIVELISLLLYEFYIRKSVHYD